MNRFEARAVEIDDTLHEIERELHRRLDLGERIAIGFALERFADRVVPIAIGFALERFADRVVPIAIVPALERFADRVVLFDRENAE